MFRNNSGSLRCCTPQYTCCKQEILVYLKKLFLPEPILIQDIASIQFTCNTPGQVFSPLTTSRFSQLPLTIVMPGTGAG